MRSLSAIARVLDHRGLLTHERARVLQRAADPDREAHYRCTHPELGGAGWSHPWPDETFYPHACCRLEEHCPGDWARG